MTTINTSQTLLTAVAAGSTQTSPSRNVSRQTFIGIQADISGAAGLSGVLKLQGRVGTLGFSDVYDSAGNQVQVTVAGLTGTGSYVLNMANICFDDFQVVWTPSAGTGTLTAQYRTKEVR